MKRFRPKLRTVLLIVNLTILLLPLGSIAALRIYETELVRQTESNLLAQGSLISMIFRDYLTERLSGHGQDYGIPASRSVNGSPEPGRFNPLLPQLNVAEDDLRPPIGDAVPPVWAPETAVVEAGRDMLPLIREAQNATLAGIRIVDAHGTVVASTGAETGLSLSAREEIRRALGGEAVSLLYMRSLPDEDSALSLLGRRTRYRVHVAVPVVRNNRVYGVVLLMRTPLDVSKALYIHRRPVAMGAMVLLAVVLVISLVTSLTISRPVKRLIRQIERLGQPEKGQPNGGLASAGLAFGTQETDRLAKAFADMSARLEQRAEYIRTFVSNVSHGFKTPLASTRAAVELLKDHLPDMTPEEQARFLDIIEDDAVRLERLVNRLTELARADTVQWRGNTAFVPAVLDDLAGRYRAYGRRIDVRHGDGVKEAAMDRDTLESIITNLVDNAAMHGGEDVAVTLVSRRIPGEGVYYVDIEVHDNGPGVSEANIDRIFRPFFTTAKDRGGSGLGLSIVQSLLHSHGGRIFLKPVESGACFVVRLPEKQAGQA